VANAEVEQRVYVAAGNWTVDLTVNVAGQQEVSQSRTVTVTPDESGEEDSMEDETEETENGTSTQTLPSSFTLESTEDTSDTPQTFYYNGESVDEISIEAGQNSITFAPRAGATYDGGAEFFSRPRSVFGVSDSVQGGDTASVSFNATEDFEIVQRWPDTNITKATLDVDVE